MKKRKPPVVLATILVVLVVGVGIVYAPRGNSEQEQQPQQATPPPETQERPKVSTSEASDFVKTSMKSSGNQDKMPQGGPHVIGAGDGSTVKVMKAPANYKPQPNDSSISTQWYSNEAHK